LATCKRGLDQPFAIGFWKARASRASIRPNAAKHVAVLQGRASRCQILRPDCAPVHNRHKGGKACPSPLAPRPSGHHHVARRPSPPPLPEAQSWPVHRPTRADSLLAATDAPMMHPPPSPTRASLAGPPARARPSKPLDAHSIAHPLPTWSPSC
jgi:hypothetical protein